MIGRAVVDVHRLNAIGRKVPIKNLSAKIHATSQFSLGNFFVLLDGQIEIDVFRAELLLKELLQ